MNIFVEHDPPDYDAAEYVIFPTSESEHRVIGVTYVFENGNYHLNTLHGNNEAECLQL